MRRSAGVLLLAALAGCQEKLTSPGGCPELCPSDNLVIEDVVLEAQLDSTFTGFLGAGEGTRLLLANGLGGEDFISVVRFARRSDSITVRDTLREFAVDSVLLTVNVEGRDPASRSRCTSFRLRFRSMPPPRMPMWRRR